MVSQLSRKNLGYLWQLIEESEIFVDWEDLDKVYSSTPELFLITPNGGLAVAVPSFYRKKTVMLRKLIANNEEKIILLEEVVSRAKKQGFNELISPLLKPDEESFFRQFSFKPFQKTYTYKWMKRSISPQQDNVVSRQATKDDLEKITLLDRQVFEKFWWYKEEQLKYFFKTGQIFLALSDSRIIGYNIFREHRGIGNIIRLGVDQEFRRLGIAQHLLWQSMIIFVARGIHDIYLCTQAENIPAQRLYQKMGYRCMPGYASFLKKKLD